MADVVLATINARHAHASLGLRWIRANLGALRERSAIVEFVCGARTESIAESILAHAPRVLGLGVYIWNVQESTALVAMLRCIAPQLRIVVGGPEVSYEIDQQPICAMADHVITGPGESAFARLCARLLDGPRPLQHVVAGDQLPLDELALPYELYDAADIAHRHLYVEASRGCPFRCEFCLSALDRTARPFALDPLLAALGELHARGARRFRFVDRTFNLKPATSRAILEFLLAWIERDPQDPVFAHFELVPDHLPATLREVIARFPAGTLQFEIGIQSFDESVQQRISRRQDNARAEQNLRWLRERSQAHLHVDLIAGLPGEDLASFGRGFDRLLALDPQEIQVGVLKRLRGAPIDRHTTRFGMRYNPQPPYNLLANDLIAFGDMQRIARFARYWDLFANSGRMPNTLRMLLADTPFARFMAFSDWLHVSTGHTHQISAERLYELAHDWLVARAQIPASVDAAAFAARVRDAVIGDYRASGARGRPAFMARGLSGERSGQRAPRNAPTPSRQRQFLRR